MYFKAAGENVIGGVAALRLDPLRAQIREQGFDLTAREMVDHEVEAEITSDPDDEKHDERDDEAFAHAEET